MGKKKKRHFRIKIQAQVEQRPGLSNDPVMTELFEPLLKAIGVERANEFWDIIAKEPEGVLAWGVRSGYLLWARTHPGAIPTRGQIAAWMIKGSQKA